MLAGAFHEEQYNLETETPTPTSLLSTLTSSLPGVWDRGRGCGTLQDGERNTKLRLYLK